MRNFTQDGVEHFVPNRAVRRAAASGQKRLDNRFTPLNSVRNLTRKINKNQPVKETFTLRVDE